MLTMFVGVQVRVAGHSVRYVMRYRLTYTELQHTHTHTQLRQAACDPKMVRKEIFGPKRDKVIAYRRQLCSEELHNVYSYPDIINTSKQGTVGRRHT